MTWIKEIEAFVPRNEQETRDKEVALRYIKTFDDILTRDNQIIHVTCSGFTINKDKDKVLMVHHNIFKSWSLTGGHADGDEELLGVAMKEVEEETGVKNLSLVSKDIISLDLLAVRGHYRKGVYVPSHLHISVVYLLEADEREPLIVKPDENSEVRWIAIRDIDELSKEEHMKVIYHKIAGRIE